MKVILTVVMILAASVRGDTNEMWGEISGTLTTEMLMTSNALTAAYFSNTTNAYYSETMTNYVTPGKTYGAGAMYAGCPVSTNIYIVLTNDAYVVGYSEKDECPHWVAYTLCEAKDAPLRPKVGFRIDRRTTTRVKDSDYDNTGYDRGHMAPSYGIGLSHGTNAQLQTFLMSNVIPQTPELNRGLWKKLEQEAAKNWAREREKLWVVTGPVFIETNRVNGVRVPAGSYKIFVDEQRHGQIEVQAYLMPQHPLEDATLGLYLTSVDEIERQTGIDFFPDLPDGLENEVERGTW